jgi:hypothetical protein
MGGQVIETEGTSKRNNRPELERALRIAKLQKAILFIPTFGQMSRNADVIGKMINAWGRGVYAGRGEFGRAWWHQGRAEGDGVGRGV